MANIIFMARLTDAGDFTAVNRAERLLEDHGFSVECTQRGQPRGIMFGDYHIEKWRNLSAQDRENLHGCMSGNRSSHALIEIRETAPIDAVIRLVESLEGQPDTIILQQPSMFRVFEV